MKNPANVVTVEARIFEVGHNLGMGRDAIEKLIRTVMAQGGRPALGEQLRKLEAKYRRACSGMEKRRDEEWFAHQRIASDEQHRQVREHSERERQQRRESCSIGERLDDALIGLTVLSNAAAGSIARKSRSSEVPLLAPLGDVPGETYGRRALLLVRAAEAELDRLRFGGSDVREPAEERNKRLIREYEGFTSWEVSFVEPNMGHPVSVERIRREHGRRGKDGRMQLREAA